MINLSTHAFVSSLANDSGDYLSSFSVIERPFLLIKCIDVAFSEIGQYQKGKKKDESRMKS